MAESLIGKTVHVCNCGPESACGHWSRKESVCSCGHPTTRRRILAEDLDGFYVSQTGTDAEAYDELGEEPMTAADRRPLQRFVLERDDYGEAVARVQQRDPSNRAGSSARSGTVLDVRWSFEPASGRESAGTLVVGERRVVLKSDGRGNFMTHTLTGLWPDPARIAENLIKFHPDFSPLARRSPRIT